MPGLRVMNQTGADGAATSREGQTLKRSYDGKLVNGEGAIARKDSPAAGSHANGAVGVPGMNGTMALASASAPPDSGSKADLSAQWEQLPPEIAHLGDEFYHPLSKLIQRISQECYNDLSETLVRLAEMPIDQVVNGAMTNGAGGHAGSNGFPNNSEANRDKKLMMIKFAQEHRAKFIKILVLLEWGKKSSHDISKLIDVTNWMKVQQQCMDDVDFQMMQMKNALNLAREPNPDLRTALEVLSTGKASWIPDLGFIPPKPVTAKKALELLRYLNTNLSIRLNVHEDLPMHLRNWRVGSGRATFTVESEFELDIFSFAEDTSDQWHFIDLRLLFSPAPVVSADSHFYHWIKLHMDRTLAESGLVTGFEFLHNFVLTHKVQTLRSQAYELVRGGWATSLKVEGVRRSLIVQYWTDRPGKKSWIEIGVSSEKSKDGGLSWRGPPISKLTARWFRQGVEMKDVDLQFNWKNLSMERMLKRVIALHASQIFQASKDILASRILAQTTLSESEPCDCSLKVSLGALDNTTTVLLEPVTGRFYLRPTTAVSTAAEHTINRSKDPLASMNEALIQLLSTSLRDLISRHAQQLGWQLLTKNGLQKETIKQAVKSDVLHFSLMWPRGWRKWALAVIIEHSGESWWIFELGANGTTIKTAERIRQEDQLQKTPASRAKLCALERVAVRLISFLTTIRDAQNRSIPYNFLQEVALPPLAHPDPHPSVPSSLRGWTLRLSVFDVLTAKAEDLTWLRPTLRVSCQGFRSDVKNVWHVVSGTMDKSVAKDMKKLMASSPQQNFMFQEDGNFSILLSVPFGESILDQLSARLRDIDRLRSFTAILLKRKMILKSSSLTQVIFQYSKDNTATVDFSEEKKIRVSFNAGNPHNRIATFLTEIVNGRNRESTTFDAQDATGLDRFCTTLLMTRPLLSCLDEIEVSTAGRLNNPALHPHGIGKYRISYSNPLCSFDVRLRPKDNDVYWHIEDNNRRGVSDRPGSERDPLRQRLDTLTTALKALYKESGSGWFGVRTSILADLDGISSALKRLHETVMSCAVDIQGGARPFKEVAPSQVNANANVQSRAKVQQQVNLGNTGRPQGKGTTNNNRREVIELD